MYHDPMMMIALHDVEKNTRQQFEETAVSPAPSRSAWLALLGMLKLRKTVERKRVSPIIGSQVRHKG